MYIVLWCGLIILSVFIGHWPSDMPTDLGCESACRLLLSTSTIATYYYKLIPVHLRCSWCTQYHLFDFVDVPVVHLICFPFPLEWHTSADNEAALHYPTINNIGKILRAFVAEYLQLTVWRCCVYRHHWSWPSKLFRHSDVMWQSVLCCGFSAFLHVVELCDIWQHMSKTSNKSGP